MESDLKDMWMEIKNLIMANAIGLHRIIGFISKVEEKVYREKINLDKGTYEAPKQEKKRKAIATATEDEVKT